MKKGDHIIIPGAGLVGSLAGLYLAKRGYRATLLDKRPRPGSPAYVQSRSINLALSHRGWTALAKVGIQAEIERIALPMAGRIVHDLEGKTSFYAYGKEGQAIYSVSRGKLNQVLNDHAEAEPLLEVHYGVRASHIDFSGPAVIADTAEGERRYDGDAVLATDGAYSAVRMGFQVSDRFDFSQEYIQHGYQEFHMPPGADGDWAMDPGGLHIWPRHSFMIIALPNPDKSFTCTLFLSFEGGQDSFAALRDAGYAHHFFSTAFPDFVALVPDWEQQARVNVVSSLVTIRCFPWAKDNCLLIGDSAHAVVPFYGQGMNAGFEDVDLLFQAMDSAPGPESWHALFTRFGASRKADADAIADLALANFVEMRDRVADPAFVWMKKIDAFLASLLPGVWIPQYTMVSFTSIPYSEARARGQRQEQTMVRIMAQPSAAEKWQDKDWLLAQL